MIFKPGVVVTQNVILDTGILEGILIEYVELNWRGERNELDYIT